MTVTNFRTSQSKVNQLENYHLLSIDELYSLPPAEWLIKRVLPRQGIASIYGASGSGKTFFMLDLLLSISCKPDWHQQKVKNVPVTYVCLESQSGIANRIRAWEVAAKYGRPENFKIITSKFSLMSDTDIRELAAAINDKNMGGGVIAIDTLNAACPNSDENASKDMGIIIASMKKLQRLTNGLILFNHHTGKDKTQGMRGHSSLIAALDIAIELKSGTKRSWRIKKNKDGEEGEEFGFKLIQHAVGIDEDGEQITSCSLELIAPSARPQLAPKGKNQMLIYKAIREACLKNDCNVHALNLQTAIEMGGNALTNISDNKRKYEARKIIETLIGSGFFCANQVDGVTWIGI
jgi:putative DNA primase/helicase